MKKALTIFSILIALIAAATIWLVYTPVVSSKDAMRPISFDSFPIDQPRIIDFRVNDEPAGETDPEALTPREQQDRQRKHLDQLRDWSLLALMAETGLSAQDLNQSVYDLPALRHDNLRQVSTFEYGETRSRVIGNGQVIALFPVASPERRADFLSHIADEQRKSLGEIPEKFFIFEYELYPAENYARITRRAAIDGKELFTEQAGYIERAIRNQSEFEQFIAKIDDITFARRTDASLILGGRKLRAQPYRGIRAEDVSAIWRSERGLTGFRSSGFSLDPHIDLNSVSKSFDTTLAPLLREHAGFGMTDLGKIRTILTEIEKARTTTKEKDREALQSNSQAYFTAALIEPCQRQTDARRCLNMVNTILWDNRFQAATYFGELQGTEVGMVLFYTDLLMKLWSLDYMESTPRRIVGFPVQTEMKVSAIYKKELEEMPATRFWLSSLDRGFQVAEEGRSLLFARNATSVFARPHDFLLGSDRPDTAEPNVFDRSFVNWWNDHYEEIARYEPEYERLNEIMKWSQVVGWLNSVQKGELLGFLEPVPLVRTNRFTTWVRQHPELTFQSWDQIKFYEPGYGGTTTEAMEVLKSKEFPFFGEPVQVSGGVSLAGRATFAERAALSQRITTMARRANLDYRLSDLASGRLRTLEATEYRFRSFAQEAAETLAHAKPSARLRGDVGELANLEIRRVVNRTSDGLMLRTRAAGTDFGDLRISRTARGYEVGWRGRDLDLGQSLARRLSNASNPDELLLRDPNLESIIKLPGERAYLLKSSGTDHWIKVAAREGDGASVAKGYQYRVAGYGDDAKTMDVAWLDDVAAQEALEGQSYLVISGEQASQTNIPMSLSLRGPPPTAQQIELASGNNLLRAHIDPESKTIYTLWKDLPPTVRANPGRIPEMIRSGRFESNQQYLRLTRELDARSYREAARDLARDPAGFRARINQHLTEELRHNNELLLKRQIEAARLQIKELIQIHGELPELSMRQAMLDLNAGQVDRAAATLRATGNGSLRNVDDFFNEINQRLSNQALSLQERNNLVSLAKFNDWRASRLRNVGELIPEAQGDSLVLKLNIHELPKGRVATLNDLNRGNRLVYIQDSPGLNNIDATPSAMVNSLRPLVSGNRVTIREVALVDIRHFSPARIYEGQTQTLFRLSNNGQFANQAPNYYRAYYSINNVAPSGNDEEDEKRERVFIVTENSSPATER